MIRTVESEQMCIACGYAHGEHSKTCPYIAEMVESRKRHRKLEEVMDERERDDEGS